MSQTHSLTGPVAPRYDVIVVGARCGGAPTAMLLARQGARVLLVDRATFPSDTMRAHFVRGVGIAALDRWGLLERVASTGCPPIDHYVTDFADGLLVAPVMALDDVETLYAPRRIVLDAILVEAAVAAGVELRQAFTVDDLLWDEGAVIGVRGRSRGGGPVTERGRLVVGADGMRSLVARRVEAPVYDVTPALSCGYYGYFDGQPVAGGAVAHYPGHFAFLTATNDDLTMAFVAAPIARLGEFRTAPETAFFRTINHVPWIADLMRGRRRAERWRGTGDLPNFFRRPYGRGWALVGDAGYHQDPISACGISNAFRDAELLAGAISSGFVGREPLVAALAGNERRRNEAARPTFDEALAWAALRPLPDEFYQRRAALRAAAA